MDKLDKLWQMQEQLDEYIAEKRGLVYPQHLEDNFVDEDGELSNLKEDALGNWLIQMCLCIFSETNELLNETPWKHWKDYPNPVAREKAKQEVIDILFFTISSAQKLEMTPDELFSEFFKKYEENVARQQGKVKGREDYGR